MLCAILILSLAAAATANLALPCFGCFPFLCDVKGELDLAFIMDWSLSTIATDEVKQFYKEIVNNVDLSGDVEVGLTYFKKNAHTLLSFGSNVGSAGACDAIELFPKKKGDTFTHNGLDEARDMFINFGRDSACRVAVVVTDGGSDLKDETVQAAIALQNLGVRMCVVQHGTGTPTEMIQRDAEVMALVGDDGQKIRNDLDPDSILPLVDDTLQCINACEEVDCSTTSPCGIHGYCFINRCICDDSYYGKLCGLHLY